MCIRAYHFIKYQHIYISVRILIHCIARDVQISQSPSLTQPRIRYLASREELGLLISATSLLLF